MINITVTNPGTGYIMAPTIVLVGGGPTATATAACTLTITGVIVLNPGIFGYTNEFTLGETPDIAIFDAAPGGAGTGATAILTLDPGTKEIANATVTSGAGYGGSPTVTFALNPALLSGNPGFPLNAGQFGGNQPGFVLPTGTVDYNAAGQVTGVTITNPGWDMLSGPVTGFAITPVSTPPLVIFSGGNGNATATATVDPHYGYVTSITITNPGSGYGITPVAVSGAGGTGSGATGYQVVDGMVTGGTVTNPGVGEFANPVTNPFTGAFANPQLEFSGGGYDTGVVDPANAVAIGQNNVYVRSVTVTSGGSNWVVAPNVVIQAPPNASTTGGVDNAQAFASIAGGVVTSVTVVYGGQGYDWYNPPTISFRGGSQTPGGTPAVATAVLDAGVFGITPSGGYGATATAGMTVAFTGGGPNVTHLRPRDRDGDRQHHIDYRHQPGQQLYRRLPADHLHHGSHWNRRVGGGHDQCKRLDPKHRRHQRRHRLHRPDHHHQRSAACHRAQLFRGPRCYNALTNIVTMFAANTFTAGQFVVVGGVNSSGPGSYDGTFMVIAANAGSFTYALPPLPGPLPPLNPGVFNGMTSNGLAAAIGAVNATATATMSITGVSFSTTLNPLNTPGAGYTSAADGHFRRHRLYHGQGGGRRRHRRRGPQSEQPDLRADHRRDHRHRHGLRHAAADHHRPLDRRRQPPIQHGIPLLGRTARRFRLLHERSGGCDRK